MEAWENNLALADANNLTLADANNLVIGVAPPPAGTHARRLPQAHFPVDLLGGRLARRERPIYTIPPFTGRPVLAHRRNFQEAIPPSLLRGNIERRGRTWTIFWTKVFRQHSRVAEDALERWELYLDEDALPAFVTPVATSTTLPFNHTPALPGPGLTKEYWAVVRKRNKYNLLSLNLHPTIITVDDAGAEELGPISDPEITRALDAATGELLVFGRYPYGPDRNPADTWELYAEDGVDPDPDVDTPLETGTFGSPAADYLWRVTTDGLTPGTTYHVMLVARRAAEADGERGESVVVQHTLAETFDLDVGTTWLFGGTDHAIES